jgi:hypothetical protein
MNKEEQRQIILNRVRHWAGSDAATEKWFNTEQIPALGCTPRQAIDRGEYDALRRYIDIIALGGFA